MTRRHNLGFLASVAFSYAAAADVPTDPGWHEVMGTQLQAVCAGENGFPSVLGASGCWSITGAWSGAVFDSNRNRMIVFGGGHNDYYGNELYAFDLDTMTMERITDPGLPIADSCTEAIVNGTQPNSRHTYDGIEYIRDHDKMFVFGGSLACGAGNFGSDTWTFDFQSNTWKRMQPAGPIPDGDAGMMTAYDPDTGLIYLHDRKHLYAYDVQLDTYTQLTDNATTLGYHLSAEIDSRARKFVIVGYDSVQGAGRVYTYDISVNSSYDQQQLSTSGGTPIVNEAYPGLAYDPNTGEIVAWSTEAGSSVYSLDVNDGTWSQMAFPGGPAPSSNGTHGRWRYSPNSKVFVTVNRVADNVYLFKSSAVAIPRPNPPSSVTAQ